MAGNKETPRQRMIGMMYLVLTALLALNVSKEIVNAFVKLDKKLLDNQQALLDKSQTVINSLTNARSDKNQRNKIEPFYLQANSIRKKSRTIENFILDFKNKLIVEVEGVNWFEKSLTKNGRKTFKPLMDIESKDDYDAATRLYGGEKGTSGYEAGAKLRNNIHEYRNWICKNLANKKVNGKSFYFDADKLFDPEFTEEKSKEYIDFIKKLDKCLATVNEQERNRIKQIYLTLTLPKKIKDYEEIVDWQLGMFDHAPVVAAAAMFTALQNDVLGAEAMALELINERVKLPQYNFNKIEPMAFAPSAYLNMGDSMTINVMTAAYDSNEVSQIKWSDVSFNEVDAKNSTSNKIKIKASKPGIHSFYGKIGVKQNNDIIWKPWSFKYEVGQPTAFASPLDMNVLYTYMDNHIGAVASGYPTERVSLSAAGCTVKLKGNAEYEVIPSPTQVGSRVNLIVTGRDENGKSKVLSTTVFKVRPLPTPALYFGSVPFSKGRISRSELLGVNSVTAGFDASIPITTVTFRVQSAKLEFRVNGNPVTRTIVNGVIDAQTKTMMRQCTSGSKIEISELRVYNNKGGQANVSSQVLTVQ